MPERKKLFLFSHVSNVRNITGAEKLLLFLARKLSASFDCTLVVPGEGRLTYLARRRGIGVLVCDIPLLYGMCSPYEGLNRDAEGLMGGKAAEQIAGLLAAHRPDGVFVNTCVNIVPPVAAKRLGIPVVWHITEVVRDNGYAEEPVRLIDCYSDRIVGISEAVLSPFRRQIAADKLNLLFPSWESGEFQPPGVGRSCGWANGGHGESGRRRRWLGISPHFSSARKAPIILSKPPWGWKKRFRMPDSSSSAGRRTAPSTVLCASWRLRREAAASSSSTTRTGSRRLTAPWTLRSFRA